MTDAEKELATLQKAMTGLIYEAFMRGQDSLSGNAGDRMKYRETAGGLFLLCIEDSKALHEAYVAFARAQVNKAAKEKK